MILDFTFDKYKLLCDALVDNYAALPVISYLTKPLPEKFVIMRHDVDRKPENALVMAKIESEMGIESTYYFRMKKDVFDPEIIKKIAEMGHEIGYHYEVLDKANGDYGRAIKLFEDELMSFREIYDVKTVCMHGNPLSKWVNRDLWNQYDFRDFGIIGEPYLSIDYDSVQYFTDTGRKWNSQFNVKDSITSNHNLKVRGTDDIIKLAENGDSSQLCILTHPNRWNSNFASWLTELIWQNTKNIGKIAIKKSRGG